MVKHILVFLLCGWCICAVERDAWAMDKECKGLYKAKKFVEAAGCFVGLLAKVDQNKAVQGVARLLKDRYLRNGAISYRQASKAAKSVDERGYLLEQGVKLLQRSFDKGYCEASRRCRSNGLLAKKWRGEIGYASLIVTTKDKDAQILVEGYKARREGLENFKQDMRPGDYKITIKRKGKTPLVVDKKLVSGKEMIINVTAEKLVVRQRTVIVAKKLPAIVVVGYIAGGVVLLGGLGFFGYGVADFARINARESDPTAKKPSASELDAERGWATMFTTVGAGVAALGAVILVVSGVSHFLLSRQKPQKKVIESMRRTKRPVLVHFSL